MKTKKIWTKSVNYYYNEYLLYFYYPFQVHLWEEPGLNPEHIRVIMDALLMLGYKYVRSLRLWKIKTEDYGLEKVCQYVREVSSVNTLDLIGNNITEKGEILLI